MFYLKKLVSFDCEENKTKKKNKKLKIPYIWFKTMGRGGGMSKKKVPADLK